MTCEICKDTGHDNTDPAHARYCECPAGRRLMDDEDEERDLAAIRQMKQLGGQPEDPLLSCPTCKPWPEWDRLEARGHAPRGITEVADGRIYAVIAKPSLGIAWWPHKGAEPIIVHGTPVRLLAWLAEQPSLGESEWVIRDTLKDDAKEAAPEVVWGSAGGEA